MLTPRLLSAGAVARLLCVSVRTVERWAKAGRLPHCRTAGGHLRIPRSAVVAFVALSTSPT